MSNQMKKRKFFNYSNLFLLLILFVIILISGCNVTDNSDDKKDLNDSNNAPIPEIKKEMNNSNIPASVNSNLSQVNPEFEVECVSDSDCVPVSCCHSTSCGPISSAPNCEGQFCTQVCTPGTTDCGGGCYCQEGLCNANLI